MRKVFSCVAAAIACFIDAAAFADSPPEDSTATGALEEIVVTAQKRAENLERTPIAITAFTAATIARAGVSNLADLAAKAPNVTFKFTAPISGAWQGMVAGDVTYRGTVNAYFASNTQFNIPLASYTLLNLRAGVINGPWSVTAFARNLTDKRAEVSAINSSQDPDALLTVRPRTVGLTATRKF